MNTYIVYFHSPVGGGAGLRNSPAIQASSEEHAIMRFWAMECSNWCTGIDHVYKY